MRILSNVCHFVPVKMVDNNSLGTLDSWFWRQGPKEVWIPVLVAEHWGAGNIGQLQWQRRERGREPRFKARPWAREFTPNLVLQYTCAYNTPLLPSLIPSLHTQHILHLFF